jgi:hypothetical protein
VQSGEHDACVDEVLHCRGVGSDRFGRLASDRPPTVAQVTLTFAGVLDRDVVVHASNLVAGLVARPEVSAAWAVESSCAGMSVGGLARHLVSQPVNVVRLLTSELPAGTETIDVLEHYARAAWVREDLDGDTNTSIRAASDEQAGEGPEAALDLVSRASEQLATALAGAPPTVYIPWQGWALDTDDFLVTRLMEMVVHADDLAASVAVPVPEFGPGVLDPVLRLLVALSVRRHGQGALVRALTRPQRAPATVAAF